MGRGKKRNGDYRLRLTIVANVVSYVTGKKFRNQRGSRRAVQQTHQGSLRPVHSSMVIRLLAEMIHFVEVEKLDRGMALARGPDGLFYKRNKGALIEE